MPWISTNDLNPQVFSALPPLHRQSLYCGLDSAVTLEILGELEPLIVPQNDPQKETFAHCARETYEFQLALQGPILELMEVGVAIDPERREQEIRKHQTVHDRVFSNLQRLAAGAWDRKFKHLKTKEIHSLNPASPKQLSEFFYEYLKLPVQYKIVKGERKPSTDRDCLEKLLGYHWAVPFIRHILKLRDLAKILQVLRTGVDPDGRFRTSFNIGGTESGRLSSSKNAFGTGGNAQNIDKNLRQIFIPSQGKKFASLDLKQAESFAIGYLSQDLGYIRACERGVHLEVARMVWPDLPWTGTKDDKELAEQPFYREYSRYYLSKRGGHAFNYYGQPPTVSRHMHVEVGVVAQFQRDYFRAFPGIPKYHQWVAQEIQTKGYLITPFDRFRRFFNRTWDDSTLREAIAHVPQSMIADITNRALLRIWKEFGRHRFQLLLQVHDALLGEYPDDPGLEAELLPALTEAMKVPVSVHDRLLTIPSDCKVGWNWGERTRDKETGEIKNPWGLMDWEGHDDRTAPRTKTSVLDFVLP